MKSIRRAITAAVVLAASMGLGMAFTPTGGDAAVACWQHQKVWEHNITWDYWKSRCDGVCDNGGEAFGDCCAPCSA